MEKNRKKERRKSKQGSPEMGDILEELCPIGTPGPVLASLRGSLEPGDMHASDSLQPLLHKAAQIQRHFRGYAEWIFTYLDRDSKGHVTPDDISRASGEIEDLTGIAASKNQLPEIAQSIFQSGRMHKEAFIQMCHSNPSIIRAWRELGGSKR